MKILKIDRREINALQSIDVFLIHFIINTY